MTGRPQRTLSAAEEGGSGRSHGTIGHVNYEDREDLLSPTVVLGAGVLAQLRSPDQDAAACLVSARELDIDLGSARDVIARFIASEAAQGAPEAALAIEEDAATHGYRFGRVLLGSFPDSSVSSARIAAIVDGMYVYELVSMIEEGAPTFSAHLTAFLDGRASRFAGHSALTGAIEEAAYLAWCTGLGTAAVMADRAQR